jgi:hypothetical protein
VNDLSTHVRTFDFNLEPIFKAYSDVACYWSLPAQEHIINQYEFFVDAKLKEYQFVTGKFKANPWNTELWSEGDRYVIEQAIGMKVKLEQSELVEVFHTFHMMYVDNFGVFHNMPIKDVW